MTQITLTPDQTRVLGTAESTLLVRDPAGQVVAVMAKCSESGASHLQAEMAAWDAASDEDFRSFIAEVEKP